MDINTITEVVRQPPARPGASGATAMRGWPAGPGCSPTSNPTCAGSSTWCRSAGTGWSPRRRPRDRRDVHDPRPVRVRGAGRLARRAAVADQLRGVPRVVQGVELGDGRRQHLHVTARGSDDHHDRGARGHLHAVVDGRIRTHRRRSRFRHRQPREHPRRRANCCARSTSRSARCASATPTGGSP